MNPCWHAFFGPASGQPQKKCHRSPTAEGPKIACLEQSVANLSKEAKNQDLGTWGAACTAKTSEKQDHHFDLKIGVFYQIEWILLTATLAQAG